MYGSSIYSPDFKNAFTNMYGSADCETDLIEWSIELFLLRSHLLPVQQLLAVACRFWNGKKLCIFGVFAMFFTMKCNVI